MRKKKKIRLILTGTQKLNFEFLQKTVNESNLQEKIKFFQYLENEDIIQLYKNAKGLIMPTLIGNSCLPLYEAFNFEIPVFYTKNLLDEDLKKYVTEFDISNPNDLVNKLLNYKKDNSKISEAKNFFKNNFSDDQITKKYDQIFQKFDYQTSIYK